MNIFNELAIAFPWYDKLQKQNRFKQNAENVTAFGLITPSDALLPFELYKTGAASVTEWLIFDLNGNVIFTISSSNYSKIRTVTRAGRVYFYYDGSALSGLNLSPAYYYSRLRFSDNALYFSEVFFIPECAFLTTDLNVPYLAFTWWNTADIAPIFYNDFTANVPYFKNLVYLDTFIHYSEPEILEDGEKDGNDEQVPTFQKAVLRYRISDMVPDFLKVALVLMQMHDEVYLTTPKGVRTGKVDNLTTNTAAEAFGAFSNIDIIIEDAVLIKKGCGENMT